MDEDMESKCSSPLVQIVPCFAVVLPFKIILAGIIVVGKSYLLRPGLNRRIGVAIRGVGRVSTGF